MFDHVANNRFSAAGITFTIRLSGNEDLWPDYRKQTRLDVSVTTALSAGKNWDRLLFTSEQRKSIQSAECV